MNRFLTGLMALFFTLALATAAQAQDKKGVAYSVSLGGLNVGTFTNMTISTHSVALAGNNVIVNVIGNVVNAPITLSGGTIAGFFLKKLTPRVGEQMTVNVEVVTIGAGPGQRCTFDLDRAYLKGVTGGELKLRTSSLPKFKCAGKR